MNDTNQLPPLPTPKFTEMIRGVPCITVTEHEHLMRAYALQARAQVHGEAATVAVDHFDNGPFEAYTNRIHPPVEIGTKLYTTQQPSQATQAEVTDERLLEIGREWTKEVGWYEFEVNDFIGCARAILALRPAAVPMTGEQWTDVLESAGPDLLDLAKQWSNNEVHVYQFVNEAEKIVKSAVLRGITAQDKKETP